MKKIFLLILTVFACKDKRLTEVQQIVGEWVGKEIRIPDRISNHKKPMQTKWDKSMTKRSITA
jgi:hypothetical protein